jgi:hypothetical protein
MPFYKANDKFQATLRTTWIASPADTTLAVTALPPNYPSIVTAAWNTDYETKFAFTGESGDSPSNYSLTGVTVLKGGTANLSEQTPLNCLNHEEFLNQYEQVVAIDDWYTQAYSTTPEFDITNSKIQKITLTGDATGSVTGVLPGQSFAIKLIQNATGGHTYTHFSGITWKSPDYTQNTAANKTTTFGFMNTGTGTYDGFLIGKDYA